MKHGKNNIKKSSLKRNSFINTNNIWPKIKNFMKITNIRKLLILYLLIILVGAVVLWLNASTKQNISFLNSLFDSTSAFTNTGLSNSDTTNYTYTIFGEIVVLILIQAGAIGITGLKIIFFIMIGKKIGLEDKLFISTEKGATKIGWSQGILKVGIITLLLSEFIFTFVLGTYFTLSSSVAKELDSFNYSFSVPGHILPEISGSSLHNNFGYSLWYGMFTAVSCTCNAGFDIFGKYSLFPFYNDFFIQFCVIIMIIIGSIGFPVFYDLIKRIKAKRTGEIFSASLFTKIAVISYFSILAASFLIVTLIEYTTPINYEIPFKIKSINAYTGQGNVVLTNFDRVMAIFFTCVSSRSAGFSTIPMQHFLSPSKAILSITMWIGGSPCSTAGGIRTTTFAISIMTIFSFVRGKAHTIIAKRKIIRETMTQSFAVFIMGIIIVLLGSLVIMYSMYKDDSFLHPTLNNPIYIFNFIDCVFESSSAFGTCGLSSGLSTLNNLTISSQIILIFLMIIGQLSISNTLLVGLGKKKFTNFSYPEERVILG